MIGARWWRSRLAVRVNHQAERSLRSLRLFRAMERYGGSEGKPQSSDPSGPEAETETETGVEGELLQYSAFWVSVYIRSEVARLVSVRRECESIPIEFSFMRLCRGDVAARAGRL